MKRKINILNILMAAALSFGAVSCNMKVIQPQAKGYLGLSLTQDDAVMVKSAVSPAEDMVFRVDVYQGEELIAGRDDYRTLASDPLSLNMGRYRVVATCGNPNVQAAFDAPLYRGETEVTIAPDKLNTANITATLANVKVSVELDPAIAEKFPTNSVVVSNGSGVGVTYSNILNNYNRLSYFAADGFLSWNVIFTTADGAKYTNSATYTGVKAQEWYKIRFSIKEVVDGAGNVAFRLIVDDSMNVSEYDLVLDFEASSPETQTQGFDLTQHTTFISGDDSDKAFNFTAEKGFKSLVITSSDDLLTKAGAAWYELVDANASTIAALAAKGLRTAAVPYGSTSASVNITDFIKSLPVGDYSMSFVAYDTKGHMERTDFDFGIMSDVEADMVGTKAGAKYVFLEGKWFANEMPEGLSFRYRKVGSVSWTEVPASAISVDVAGKIYKTRVDGLDAQTAYEVCAVSAKDKDTRTVSFTTQATPGVYNLGFDDWYLDGKVWYPYAQGASPSVWDSANKAAAGFIGSSTTPEETLVIKGKAAKMVSKYAMIAFAAGNIYIGKFNSISGVGADLDWGTPFNGRPLALKGYYAYSPQAINRVKGEGEKYKGQMDKCQIQIILADWDKPFNVNTNNGVFVDVVNDPHIIGFARLETDNDTNGSYQEFTLPIEYRSGRTPKYIVISCASSYLGDYFTGGENSTLYIDEFSLEYDPAGLSASELEKTGFDRY